MKSLKILQLLSLTLLTQACPTEDKNTQPQPKAEQTQEEVKQPVVQQDSTETEQTQKKGYKPVDQKHFTEPPVKPIIFNSFFETLSEYKGYIPAVIVTALMFSPQGRGAGKKILKNIHRMKLSNKQIKKLKSILKAKNIFAAKQDLSDCFGPESTLFKGLRDSNTLKEMQRIVNTALGE